MKIAVLAGGTSTEREISIVSGSKDCEALMYFAEKKMRKRIQFLQTLLIWIKRSHI